LYKTDGKRRGFEGGDEKYANQVCERGKAGRNLPKLKPTPSGRQEKDGRCDFGLRPETRAVDQRPSLKAAKVAGLPVVVCGLQGEAGVDHEVKGSFILKVRIEFEFESKNFLKHMHEASWCDAIVCWKHNWPECPLEVIALSDQQSAKSKTYHGGTETRRESGDRDRKRKTLTTDEHG
jgi:hypothetical protein